MLSRIYSLYFLMALVTTLVCSAVLAQTPKSESTPSSTKEDELLERIQSVAGFKDAKSFKKFFLDFQAALGRNDKSAISRLISFPLQLNNQTGKTTISNAKRLEKKFDQAFTLSVKEAVKNQVFEELFVRSEGVMAGDGEVWFVATENGKPRLIINLADQKNKL